MLSKILLNCSGFSICGRWPVSSMKNSLRLEKITSIFSKVSYGTTRHFTPYCKYGNVGLIYFFMNAIK